jgi:DNA (cytosine-5)-methyltransferase 1
MGLARAGFDVVGVDLVRQANYPFPFVQANALEPPFDLGEFDLIWASPVCKGYSITAKLWPGREHPMLIPETRAMLKASGVPYVIENVVGAPLVNPLRLCGTMFGLRVFRHRLFESSFWMMEPSHAAHRGTTNSSRAYSTFDSGADMICLAGHNFRRTDGAKAMEIDWHTTRDELAQAIPPAYSEYIARAFIAENSNSRQALKDNADAG